MTNLEKLKVNLDSRKKSLKNKRARSKLSMDKRFDIEQRACAMNVLSINTMNLPDATILRLLQGQIEVHKVIERLRRELRDSEKSQTQLTQEILEIQKGIKNLNNGGKRGRQ